MRTVRYSHTFDQQLIDYIDHGAQRFGAAVADEKKDLIYQTIENLIAANPSIKRPDPKLGLVAYPITGTPFFVLYDFNDAELRVHFIFIKGKPLSGIDPASAEW
jgi:plasmid stabilization system protein ParE